MTFEAGVRVVTRDEVMRTLWVGHVREDQPHLGAMGALKGFQQENAKQLEF